MAPEMIEMIVDNQDYTTRSEELPKYKFKCDIYSFAMVCYEILTGDLPFKDEAKPSIVKKMVLKGERPKLPPYCPSVLKTLIQECWSSKPEDRPTFGIICSRLKYLKYLLIRGEIIQEGAEPTFDHIQLRESGYSTEIDDTMALTLKVDGSSETKQFKNTAIFDTSLTAGPSVGGPCIFTFFTKPVFEDWFPNRCQDIYTFNAFAAALKAFPVFGSTGTMDDMKREVAAFFANVNHETAGLMYVKEIGVTFDYCNSATTLYPPAPGKAYYGRGPIQLTWNYNYGECGQDLGLDLLADPDQVAEDGTIAFKTALWFWMKQNCHGAIIGPPPSFAGTIRIIGGAIECGHGTDHRVENRVNAYTRFCSRLGVHPGTDLRC
ncbi:hypothetical protein M758_3G212600 [Ceratodon purpureus]|nr:hypothetical protein M758_3G212600 [Ceratodon purpureus]